MFFSSAPDPNWKGVSDPGPDPFGFFLLSVNQFSEELLNKFFSDSFRIRAPPILIRNDILFSESGSGKSTTLCPVSCL
jgi:hypothetical protein